MRRTPATDLATLGVAACLGAAESPAAPRSPEPRAVLTADDAGLGDAFSGAIAISGPHLVIGADLDDDACPSTSACNSGAAYVFVRAPGAGPWAQLQKLAGLGVRTGDRFGSALAAAPGIIVAGAYGDDTRAPNGGAAYVFEFAAGWWTQTAKLTAADAAASDNFGSAVAASEDTIAVAAMLDDDAGATSGGAYIFTRDGAGGWTQHAKLVPADLRAGDRFGTSMAMDGGALAIGAPLHDLPQASDAGVVYVYEQDTNGAWTPTAKLAASDRLALDRLGTSVSLSGRWLAAGAYAGQANCAGCPTDTGAVYIFERVGDAWIERAKLTSPAGAVGDDFGSALHLAGDDLLVGAPNEDGATINSGAAYLYRRNGAEWSLVARITRPAPTDRDMLGRAAVIAGRDVIVGAPGDDSRAIGAGAAEVMGDAPCACDLTGDGIVDTADVHALMAEWGRKGGSFADINADGAVNGADMAVLLGAWGPCR